MLDELEHELLSRFIARGKAASVAELHEGLVPNWTLGPLDSLRRQGFLKFAGQDKHDQARYAVTPAGHEAHAKPPVPPPPPPSAPAAKPVRVARHGIPDTIRSPLRPG